MNEQTCEGPKIQQGAGKATGQGQPEYVMEPPGWRMPQEGQGEPGRGIQQRWEAQWQEFLKTLQAPQSAWGNPQLSGTAPWDDAKAFLASFEQVAEACRWPRAEWVARLLPALSGEAQQAFSLLEARDKEDYGKVKAAILRGDALRRETQRQHFRQFCCQELEDPRRMYSRLQELCCRWLKPERHTKEQILELLVLEQFLASLPVDVQGWIRAGGPDSCAQAVALLEDFLLSRREAKTGTWQEPLREWSLGPVDVKKEPLDMEQGEISKEHAEIFKDTKQNVDGEVALPGIGIAHPTSLLPPEGQDVAEAELTKAPVDQVMSPSKTGGSLHMVEQILMQSSQQTTFWKVLQEDGENVDSMEGFFSPQLDIVRHPVKKEQTCLLDPVIRQRLPGQDSDDGKGSRLKVKNYQAGGNETEAPGTMPRGTQGNVLVKAEVQAERREPNSRQGAEPRVGRKESGELPEGLGAACNNSSTVDTEGYKASFSKYGRRYRPKSGLVLEYIGEEYDEGPPLCEKIQVKSELEKNQSGQMEMKNYDSLEFGVSLQSNSLTKHQRTHSVENPHKCPSCGKCFSWRSGLTRHRKIHIGEKPHKCPECGKPFRDVADLRRHQIIHTEKRPHQCPKCGKHFRDVTNLRLHQTVHTGRKAYQCPECGKNFAWRSQLFRHKKMHAGEKLYQDWAVNSHTQNSYLHPPLSDSVASANPKQEASCMLITI